MTTYNFGDIVLITFPYSGGVGRKQRPALVILDTGDEDVVLAPITTRERKAKGDMFLEEWSEAGLLTTSWARLAKIACLKKMDIVRQLGSITNHDRESLITVWCGIYILHSRFNEEVDLSHPVRRRNSNE